MGPKWTCATLASNFRATHMAAATLRPSLTPLGVYLKEYCTWNPPPRFT